MAEDDATGSATADQGTSRDAFLSYASADATVAGEVCAHVEAAGLSVWMAPRDVPAGAQYADAIVRGINGARAMILVLSAQAVASAHVGKEIERASSKRRPIIALKTDDTPLTPALEYHLSESQWVDASAGMAPALARLTDGLRRILSGPPGAAPAHEPRAAPPPPASAPAPKGTVRTLGLVLAALVVLLGGWYAAQKSGWVHDPRTPAPAAGTSAATAQKSIAVLPFTDLSERKDQEYFSDGLSEELIDLLGKVPGLRVPARTSSFYFKGKQATLADIGKALNVTHVLEGSVRKSGDALRITTELIAVGDDSRVWSQTYDRKLDDVFKVQDDIAGSVVAALKVSVLGERPVRVAPTANSAAYLHFLRGQQLMNMDDAIHAEELLHELEQSVALDPNFAEAWTLLGTAKINWFVGGGHGVYSDVRSAGIDALKRALAADPKSARAHAELARVYYMIDFDAPAAHRELDQALSLDPTEVAALWLAGYIANTEGQFDRSIEMHRRALDRDPLFIDNYRQIGNAYYRSGRNAEAIGILGEAAQRFPLAPTVHYRRGLALLALGDATAALADFRLETQHDFLTLGQPLALDRLGRHGEADRLLAEGLADPQIVGGAAYQIALIYAARNDRDNAFLWLDRAWRQRDAGMHWMKFDPLLRPLAGDARFKALLVAMNES